MLGQCKDTNFIFNCFGSIDLMFEAFQDFLLTLLLKANQDEEIN